MTTVEFRTNIDCCQRFMASNSGLSLEAINPLIGDQVRVYHDSKFEIIMEVVERKWQLINGATPTLYCWLGKPNGMTILEFQEVLEMRGFRL